MARPSCVGRVSSSSSPVTAPASSVMTPPAVEANALRSSPAPLTLGGPARRQHPLERPLLGGADRHPPPRLDPHPPAGVLAAVRGVGRPPRLRDRKSTRLNSSHTVISYA